MVKPGDKAVRGPREPEPQRRDRATDQDTSTGSVRDASSPGNTADKAIDGPLERDE